MSRAVSRKNVLGDVDAKTASRLVQGSSDIALVLDDEGTILDMVIQDSDLSGLATRDWVGRPWVQTVTVESRQKVEELLRDAEAAAVQARWRHVNHPTKGGDDLPVLYSAVRIVEGRGSAKGGGAGRIVVFGRNLRATVALQRRLVETQQSMELDYWRFREAETRYRHLFHTSAEAVLIVDGVTQKLLEANPAARALCGDVRGKLVGTALPALFDARAAESVQALLAAARSIGKKDAVPALLADGLRAVLVSASVFRQDDSAFVLVRLIPQAPAVVPGRRAAKSSAAGAVPASAVDATLRSFVENAPDGLVFTDPQGRVLSANASFVALAQATTDDQIRGQMLDRWVGRTGVELGVLITNLRQRGAVGLFITAVRGEYGAVTEVEIAGSVLTATTEPVLAFAIRNIERRTKAEPAASATVTRSVGELTELVGNVPLKEIVSETTDLIEQLCIETALEMTGDNRASAALLLGLSRQSLYVKLRRFGLGDLGAEAEPA